MNIQISPLHSDNLRNPEHSQLQPDIFKDNMTPIDQMTIGQLASTLRDLTTVVAIITIGYKTRSFLQPIFDFFKRANNFMTSMERNMDVLLNNHMRHIESDIRHMSGRDYETHLFSETHHASREQSATDSDGDSGASPGGFEREE